MDKGTIQTNRDWLLSLDNGKLAQAILELAYNSGFYNATRDSVFQVRYDQLIYVCNWLEDKREVWRDQLY